MSTQEHPLGISFEFFPPTTDVGREKLMQTRNALAERKPHFFSVTYGAGGSTQARTVNTVKQVSECGITTAPHISCVGSDKGELRELLVNYRESGIDSLVALRGDLPSGMGSIGELRYANELVEFIREETGNHFEIAVAAYPESHPQAPSFDKDLENFVRKMRAGANMAITQYFFNADAYFHFVDRVRPWASRPLSCRVSCRSPITPSWRVFPMPAAPISRAGYASSSRPTATIGKASRPSAKRW